MRYSLDLSHTLALFQFVSPFVAKGFANFPWLVRLPKLEFSTPGFHEGNVTAKLVTSSSQSWLCGRLHAKAIVT